MARKKTINLPTDQPEPTKHTKAQNNTCTERKLAELGCSPISVILGHTPLINKL